MVSNRATLPQKWPRPSQNVADSRDLTEMTKPKEQCILLGRVGVIVARRPHLGGVPGLGLDLSHFGFGIQVLGFEVWGLGFRFWGFVFGV